MTITTAVSVQTEDFDVSHEIAAVRRDNPRIGAIVSFVGVVRDLNDGDSVAEMTLEHYPGMTEKSIDDIITEARALGRDERAGDSPCRHAKTAGSDRAGGGGERASR